MLDHTPLNPDRVRAWLVPFHVGREELAPQQDLRISRNALVEAVAEQLVVVVSSMNSAFGKIEPIIVNIAELPAELEEAIFPDDGRLSGDIGEFYSLATAAIRKWILTRLKRLTPATTDSATRRRLAAWSGYHRTTGQLPKRLRFVHDLYLYAGLAPEETTNVLGITLSELESRRLELINLISPLLEKASGEQK